MDLKNNIKLVSDMNAWKLVREDVMIWYKQVLIGIVFLALLNALFHNVCPLVLMVGLPCPACGFTRALLLVLQGQFVPAFYMHPMIYMALLFLIYFCWMRYIKQKRVPFAKGIVVALLMVALGIYGYRMITYFPHKAPMVYEPNNLVRMVERYRTK